MNQKIKIGNGGVITLTDKFYFASGGEASIYVTNGMAYKLYHEPTKKQLPLQKMKELATINNDQVIIPQELIYDAKNGNPLGYTTKFIVDAEPILKYFTKTFKNDNNISFLMIIDLIKKMQEITLDIHNSKCLVVDYNELNILIKAENGGLIPYYIDCDSYQTPSFKSSAVMKSIMDRRVANTTNHGHLDYHPDEMSDWFSWGILSFNALINIHPFRVSHPNYRPNQKEKQMDDNVSVFDPQSKMPPSVNPLTIIPKRLLDWYKFIFSDIKNRSIPPLPDSSVPLVVPTQLVTITGTDKITVEEVNSYDSHIIDVFSIMGITYVATKTHIYNKNKEIGTHNAKKILLCAALDGTLITAQQENSSKILFKNKTDAIGTATSSMMFSRNNAIYTLGHGKLIENSFVSFGSKIVHRTTEVENVSTTSATVYPGCVVQDLLRRWYITIPYKLGSCFSKPLMELFGYRIIDAKSEKTVTVIIAEKSGKYDRFILVFTKDYSDFNIRKVEDISYDKINFTVLDNGLCMLLSTQDELELFYDNKNIEIIKSPPFDCTMPLFSSSDGVFFINGNSIHKIQKS